MIELIFAALVFIVCYAVFLFMKGRSDA